MARSRAYENGRKAGDNAAGWWIQDNGGGRDTRGPSELSDWAAGLLAKMDDGDCMVSDMMSCPVNLSGEWAGDMTMQDVASLYARPLTGARLDDACSEWEEGAQDGWYNAITTHLRDLLTPEEV